MTNRSETPRAPLPVKLAAGLSAAVLGLGLGWALLSLPTEADGLSQAVNEHLKASGAGNPVTAVLLNFRGYDTLLEIGVLVLALLGEQALRGEGESAWVPRPCGPILGGMLRVLTPLIVLFAGYLVWVGGDEPGGAFQSGAVLAAAGVVLLLAGLTPPRLWRVWLERWLVILGLVVFIVAALLCEVLGGALLAYPPGQAKLWILLIEGAASFSIALVLVLLFARRPLGHTGKEEDR